METHIAHEENHIANFIGWKRVRRSLEQRIENAAIDTRRAVGILQRRSTSLLPRKKQLKRARKAAEAIQREQYLLNSLTRVNKALDEARAKAFPNGVEPCSSPAST